MEFNDLFTNVELLRALATVFAALVLSGLSVIALKYGYAKPLADGLLWFRENRTQLLAQVDEANDTINVQLENATGVPAEYWAKVLPILVNAFTDSEATPLGEKETA